MKKFEEELNNGLVSIGQNIITKEYAYGKCTLINYFKDWVSPEDHQQVAKALVNTTDKLDCAEERVGLLEKTVNQLKSQLEKQQPEIPEFVAEVFGNNDVFLTAEKMDIISWFNDRNSDRAWDKVTLWARENEEQFIQYVLNFKPVAKEKRFYLKNKLTGLYLAIDSSTYIEIEEKWLDAKRITSYKPFFTQQEIDSMETGSYEQIEVEEE